MERRKFIKLGLLTIPSMYLFPDKLLGRSIKATSLSGRSGKQDIRMPDIYSGKISEGDIFMPEEFWSMISGNALHVVAPEQEDIIGLISGDDTQTRLLKDIREFNRSNRENLFCHIFPARVCEMGRIEIPRKVKTISDIGTGKISVAHLDKKELIRTNDSEMILDKNNAGISADLGYYFENFTFFLIYPSQA